MKNCSVKKNYTKGFFLIYVGILFLLCFLRIFDNSFWGDECFSIRLVKMGFGEMIQATASDVHPPLYYMILRVVCRILGEKGYVYHLVSVIPVGLTLLFCITKVNKKFGLYVSLMLATFVVLLDSAVLFSVEVRMYSWVNFFVLMSFYEMHEIIMENKRSNWVLFSVFTLAAAYTHYYALIAVAFLYVMLIVYEIWKKGHTWKRTASICVTAVIVYLPWLVNLLQAFVKTSGSWWVQEIPKFRHCIQFLFASNVSKISWLYVGIWGLGILILIYKTYVVKQEDYEFTFFIVAGIISIVGTIGFGEIISIIWRPLFQTKYTYVVAGIAWFILGLVLSRLPKGNIGILSIIALTLIIGIPNYCIKMKLDKECEKDLQVILENTSVMEDTDILLTNSDHLGWTILEYYYPDNESIMLTDEISENNIDEADWLFWESNLDEMKDYKVAEGWMGPYNYIHVYKIEK